MNITVVQLGYLGICLALTIYFGISLHRRNRIFLMDVYRGNSGLASSIHRLITAGFFLVMTGDVVATGLDSPASSNFWFDLQAQAGKFGFFLFLLGAMHLVSVFLLGRMSQSARRNGNHGESILA